MNFYGQIKTAKRQTRDLLGPLQQRIKNRLRAELISANPVISVTLSNLMRPYQGTIYVKVESSTQVSINGKGLFTVTFDGATVNENVGFSGLDMVMVGAAIVGNETEIRVTGDIIFPKIKLGMKETDDLTQAIGGLTRTEDNLNLLSQVHGWFYHNRRTGEALLGGDRVPQPSNTTVHYVAQWEKSWKDIERRFGVPWKTIAAYNQIEPYELQTGLRLVIPLPSKGEPSLIQGNRVFGSQAGKQAWGRDADRKLTVTDGDIKLLNNSESLVQALCILVENAGWQIIGDAFPDEVEDQLISDRLSAAITSDQRFRRVQVVDSKRSGQSGIEVQLIVYPVNQQRFDVVYTELGDRRFIVCRCGGETYTFKDGGLYVA